MTELLLSPALPWALTAGAVVFGAAGAFGRKCPLLWAFLSGLCTVFAVLVLLVLGRTLTQALTPVLAVLAISLIGLTRREGEEGT